MMEAKQDVGGPPGVGGGGGGVGEVRRQGR